VNWLLVYIFQIAVFVLILAEIMIPSGGLISIGALIFFSISWYKIIQDGSPAAIWGFAVADAILYPAAVILGLRWLRKTGLENREELKDSDGYQVNWHLPPELAGQTGVAVNVLRPSGKIEVNGEIYEALSSGAMIATGEKVEVLSVEENKVLVAPLPAELKE